MPFTKFALEEKYSYLEGFGSYHQSEAFPGANPVGQNTPQRPPYGTLIERISGSSFTAPRAKNLQTWMCRVHSCLNHTEFVPYEASSKASSRPEKLQPHLTPNSYQWPAFPVEKDSDWIASQRLLAQTGDPITKTGLAISVFAVSKDMSPRTVFNSLDGDMLIIIQHGALDIQTELGNLLVRQNEIALLPRGIRYRVTVSDGSARGYICELFQGHFQLPELGPVGSCSLANVRDFQIPTARFDGALHEGKARANDAGSEWNIISKLDHRLFSCTQDHTPFDVTAWHGTYYPYKYDLGRYSVLGSVLFDHPDPSLFTVLTAPSNREPGTAVADFAIIPPRWQMMEDSYWLPYYHRNTMSEFSGPIIYDQSPDSPWNQGDKLSFKPYGAALSSCMTSHGATAEEHEKASTRELKPEKATQAGLTIFLLETEAPLRLTEWAEAAAKQNFKAQVRQRL